MGSRQGPREWERLAWESWASLLSLLCKCCPSLPKGSEAGASPGGEGEGMTLPGSCDLRKTSPGGR